MDILRQYSKRSDLLVDLDATLLGLEQTQQNPTQKRRSVSSTGRSNRQWSLEDRLSERDIQALVDGYRQGIPMYKLAPQFGISDSSVKRIIRRLRAAGWIIERTSNS